MMMTIRTMTITIQICRGLAFIKPWLCSSITTQERSTQHLMDDKANWWFVAVHLFNCWVIFDSLWSHELYSKPGFPVLYYLLEFAHIYVHWVPNAIQVSHPLLPLSFCPHSFPASGAFSLSWLFTSGGQSIGASAPVSLSLTIFRVDLL